MHIFSKKRKRSRNNKRRWTRVLSLLMFLLAIEFGILALSEKSHLDNSQKKFEALSQQVHEYNAENNASDHSAVAEQSSPNSQSQLPEPSPYMLLESENPDFYGWLQIDGTTVDYPVMHTPDDPEKYLHLDFDGQYSVTGTPFLDERCTSDSDNLIIYAHNMNNGTMFKDLLKYKDETYWKEHPIIHFNTLNEQHDYEIMSVFYDRVYYQYEEGFRYYNFINAESESDYNQAVQEYLDKSLYDTGVSAKSGDQLLTLSTCSYHEQDGRFVVVAREISQQ